MSMLVSLYTSSGIVFAADRALVARDGVKTVAHPRGDRPKVFEIPRLGVANSGVVGFFGLAEIGGTAMDEWLTAALDEWEGSEEIEDFAQYLRDRLNGASVRPRERGTEPSGFHVGAFVRRDGLEVPSFCFVRNCFDLDPARGTWGIVLEEWHSSEQFLSQIEVPLAEIRDGLGARELASGFPFWYRNGDLPFFSQPFNALAGAIGGLVQSPAFAAPDAIDAWKEIAELFVSSAGGLYRLFYRRGAPTVGEDADVVVVPWPEGATQGQPDPPNSAEA